MTRAKTFREILEEQMGESDPEPASGASPSGLVDDIFFFENLGPRSFRHANQTKAYAAWAQSTEKEFTAESSGESVPSASPKQAPRSWSPAQVVAIEQLRKMGAGTLSEISSEADIKRAYRTLARQWHPDMHVGADPRRLEFVTERFCEIREYFEILLESEREAA